MLSGMDLKVKRITSGVKLQEVARILGVSNAFVTYMETGRRNISEDKYKKWIEFLGV